MRLLISMVLVALNAASVLAADNQLPPCLGALCGRKPIIMGSTLTFDVAEEIYTKAETSIVKDDLAGTWVHIATINHPENQHFVHTGSKDVVNLDGVVRRGRTMTLEFAGHREGDRWVANVPFGVTKKHLGETQFDGPYLVSIEDLTARFSVFGYRHWWEVTRDYYYIVECRFSPKKDLFCSITPDGNLDGGGFESRQWQGKRVGYFVYRRAA